MWILVKDIGSNYPVIIGVGCKTFSSGVIIGFEKAVNVGTYHQGLYTRS